MVVEIESSLLFPASNTKCFWKVLVFWNSLNVILIENYANVAQVAQNQRTLGLLHKTFTGEKLRLF